MVFPLLMTWLSLTCQEPVFQGDVAPLYAPCATIQAAEDPEERCTTLKVMAEHPGRYLVIKGWQFHESGHLVVLGVETPLAVWHVCLCEAAEHFPGYVLWGDYDPCPLL